MKTVIAGLFGLCSLALVSTVSAATLNHYDNVTQYQGKHSFASIVAHTLQQARKQYGKAAKQHVLIALDDDNTLTTMPQFLGGVAWFNWQASLLGTQSPQRVSSSFTDLLQAQRLLFVMSKMKLTDTHIPQVLNHFAQQGLPIIVNTARGPDFADLTEHQFLSDALVDQHRLHTPVLFTSRGLRNLHDGSTSYPGMLHCGTGKHSFQRPAAYYNGVLYLSGQNKGLGLECLQQKLGYSVSANKRQFTYIIFMDDVTSRLQQVADQYRNTPGVHVVTIHFTKYLSRDHLPHNKTVAEKVEHLATERYQHLMHAMQKNLPQANVPGKG